MPVDAPSSYCSRGLPTDFYWYGCPDLDLAANIDAAVEALMDCVSTGGRAWNPHTRAAARADFKARLRLASRGEFRPADDVKPLRRAIRQRMHEIRWTGITISRIDESGCERGDQVQVRLIYAEPMELAAPCAIGLHAHEKRLYP
jgi:hypothetical protein